jgi:hypothetical protein
MRRVLSVAGCILALAVASPASAQLWGASADGDYFNLAGTPGYDANVAVNVPLSWDSLSAELHAGLHSGGSAHDFDIGGAAIWNDPNNEFRLAAVGTYNHDIILVRANETTIGAGGEWYPLSWATLGAQGGGIIGTLEGEYGGGALKIYPLEDFSLAGNVLYTSVSKGGLKLNETDYRVGGEWLVSETFPLAITSNYTRVHFGGIASASANVWSVGFKFYINEFGAGGLVQRDRTGSLDTIGPIHPVLLSY